ncbi:hypothetical protein EVJ58_g6904 [Rhodofomes roseus]|uniref:MYND-type domain-containing protein n=1 Tax=Rhodofomes roseus TaxID=34475 RepID=A0A4Y9Y7U8_9APHY|nr:hypothetical protein EVJ58_g6904 [Rhodofomes roseus]
MPVRVLDEVALLFTDCMQDAAHPIHCARVLCACLHLLDGRGNGKRYALDVRFLIPRSNEYDYIRKTYPEYLNACTAFLSLPRSEEEVRKLNTDISTCTCSTPPDENTRRLLEWLHTFEPTRLFTLEDFIRALVRHLAGVLHNAVTSKTVGGVTAIRGLKKNRKKYAGVPLWPKDSSELIPHGLERSMQGYAATFRLCGEPRIEETLLLINNLLAIRGRSIIPYLLQLDPEWPMKISHLAMGLLVERRRTLGRPVDIGTQLSWMETLILLMECCGRLADGGIVNATDIAMFVRVVWPRGPEGGCQCCGILFVCDALIKELPLFLDGTSLSIFTAEDITRFIQLFACYGATFYAHKPSTDTTDYCREIVDTYNLMQAASRFADPFVAAFNGLIWAITMRRCAAPECRETFATAGRSFARCAGCGVMRYCSRECQTRAWKHATFSHKAVCAKMRVLSDRTRLPSVSAVAADRGRQSFIDACRADEDLGALARDCACHMQDLMAARNDHSEATMTEAFRELHGSSPPLGDRAV